MENSWIFLQCLIRLSGKKTIEGDKKKMSRLMEKIILKDNPHLFRCRHGFVPVKIVATQQKIHGFFIRIWTKMSEKEMQVFFENSGEYVFRKKVSLEYTLYLPLEARE